MLSIAILFYTHLRRTHVPLVQFTDEMVDKQTTYRKYHHTTTNQPRTTHLQTESKNTLVIGRTVHTDGIMITIYNTSHRLLDISAQERIHSFIAVGFIFVCTVA